MDNLVILGAVAPDPLDRGSFFDPGCYRVRLQLNRRPTPTETRLVKTMLGSARELGRKAEEAAKKEGN